MMATPIQNYAFPYFAPPTPHYFPSPPKVVPPPKPLTPPAPSQSTPPPPIVRPPPPNIVPTPPTPAKPPRHSIPPPHPMAPPPPHIIPPPAPSPSGGNTIIIVVFVSLGGLFFLAFLSVALCCFIKKKKKMVQETDAINIDEHFKVQEAIIPGPRGTQTVILSIEEDAHIQEEIKKNEVVRVGSHAKSTNRDGVLQASESEDKAPYSSSYSHQLTKHDH